MFLKDAISPAKPTNDVDNFAASPTPNPIDVAMSPKLDAISNAVPDAIPYVFKDVLAKSVTDPDALLNDTSTLFNDSLKSDAILIDAAPAANNGAVTYVDNVLPMSAAFFENATNDFCASDNAKSRSVASPVIRTFSSSAIM